MIIDSCWGVLMIVDDCWWLLMIIGDFRWLLMIIDDCWWLLMIADDCWWLMMGKANSHAYRFASQSTAGPNFGHSAHISASLELLADWPQATWKWENHVSLKLAYRWARCLQNFWKMSQKNQRLTCPLFVMPPEPRQEILGWARPVLMKANMESAIILQKFELMNKSMYINVATIFAERKR